MAALRPLEATVVDWFRHQYLPDTETQSDWRAAPILADDHAGLPPAIVLLAECDVLVDEGKSYAKRLEDAGVKTSLKIYPGMIHVKAVNGELH